MVRTTGGLPTHKNRLQHVLEQVKSKDGQERLAFLESELKAALALRQLEMVEALSVSYGAGSLSFNTEDPVNDDGERWAPVGPSTLPGGPAFCASNPALRTLDDLRRARDDGRRLALGNKFARGAHNTRCNYIVGYGLTWTAVPKDIKTENEKATREINDAIKRIREQENWAALEREFVHRSDRDGEAFLRIYPQHDRAPRFRFVEPEHVHPPAMSHGDDPFGVRVESGEVGGYWIVESGSEPTFVPRLWDGLDVRPAGLGIPRVIHHKMNVDQNAHRGWPTFYAMRGSLMRAEKLLQNMSWVAALQAAIALIKKYDNASQGQIEAMLAAQTDLTVNNTTTGKRTEHVEFKPGTIVHAPKGQSYEAPVSSVNAAHNVEVLQAELRAAAASVNQPEYLFSGDSSGAAYSSQLVAESPFVKQVEADQWAFHVPLHAAMQAALIHEEFMDRLPRGTFENYELQCEFPNPVVRDVLQDRQGKQIMVAAGVLSRKTWRASEGLDDTTEERNIDAENARGYTDIRKGAEPDKPPPGSTDGGPGGLDQKPAAPGEPGRPPSEEAQAHEARTLEAVSQIGEPVPSLNGSQIAAMQTALTAVARGELPGAAAIEMLVVAFPNVSREQIEKMVNCCRRDMPPPMPT